MTQFIPEEARRLHALDEGLRAEADRMLAASGLGEIIREAGHVPVGSYVMRTMTWRDLDFERTEDEPDWDGHWALGARLAKTGWLWRTSCVDAYRDPRDPEGRGLYWGLRAADPKGGPTWKLDLWTARAAEFEPATPKREEWRRNMTEDARVHILAIKEAICQAPEYRDTLLSVHVYEAVLEQGVRGLEAFREWWQAIYGVAARLRGKDAQILDPSQRTHNL